MHISEAEAEVMDVLWARSPRGAEEVVAALAGRQAWAEATVKTLLNRLLTKGAISAGRDGRRYLYSPVLQREEWLAQQSDGLLDRLFGGRVAPLVAHFGERQKLSKADIDELRALIETLEDGRG
ncbi:BlaI/MecI/CopY family transcriptional regulator [Luteimonas fraxinea]|uniref:BlaI/MecI/CopY family transcriptional regulator n=1 Tax=Luteimonas fraxinea TaxID=2901869 RepID=A0ABS8UI17_9GAMM|nr:BlaI/MecI/CopY family transcriptional regulator [Luteimonas fraxinea]MCD9098140.1 BlaI/MecI/CopY family transcriptional regulator [Luteimonas fraxinea]MCD9125330.1 BlaI/MecI/CopY family transcriptional regulator [Luteimonas fraxinea]UHH09136.1 BlaI/MecI/CopY family transcriptional regulator [Luteimonas fraxinea]